MNWKELDYDDERWKMKSNDRKALDNRTCSSCRKKTGYMNAHHLKYEGERIWDTPLEHLTTFCEKCHTIISRKDKDWNDYVLKFATNFFAELISKFRQLRPGTRINKQVAMLVPFSKSPTSKNNIYVSFSPYRHPDFVKLQRLKIRIDYPIESGYQLIHSTNSTREFNDEIVSNYWSVEEGLEKTTLPFTTFVCTSRTAINPEQELADYDVCRFANHLNIITEKFDPSLPITKPQII